MTAMQMQTTEPIPIEEQFVAGPAGPVRVIHGIGHVQLYVDHVEPPELGGGSSRRIAVRLMMPLAGLGELGRLLCEAVQQAASIVPSM